MISNEERNILIKEIRDLCEEHKRIDKEIKQAQEKNSCIIEIQRLRKAKLQLEQKILQLESFILPNDIA